jgi:hypothetical protein
VLAAVFVARSATWVVSPAPRSCAPGPGSPRVTASPTPPCVVVPSPNRVPRLVRWAAVEATQRLPRASKQAADFHRIADRRGTGIGRVAAASKLLTLVYYGLRDGQVRCLAPAPREAM